MILDSQLKLGQSTSLLNGYNPDIYSVHFTTSSKPALYEKQVIINSPDCDAKWSWPTITLHDNVEDLLGAVLQIKLRPITSENKPSEGGASAVWPSGALILAGLTGCVRKKALTDLSSQLGIDLLKDGWSYALARRSRKIGTATHCCYERGIFGHPDPKNTLKPDALAALKSLEKLAKESTNVSMHGANGYLKFYDTYGSHFVSCIEAGDSIFQVFAFAAAEYKDVVKIYTENSGDLSGPTSPSFSLYTIPQNETTYGHTAAIGKICIASRDPKLEKSLKDGLWLDKKFAGTDSIFTPFLRSDAINVNTTLKKIVAISVELASLGVFAEFYRMLIWRRVFKGAMYARYADGSGVFPYFSNNCPYDLNAVFKGSDVIGGDGLLSTLATPSVNIWKEKIDLGTIVLQFPDLVNVFSVFASGIQIPSPLSMDNTAIDVPGSSTVTLVGHVISSGGTGPVPPHLRLADSAIKEIKTRVFCGEFYGGLRISNADGSITYVIMNGLMFEVNEGKVEVVRDVRESPTMQVLTERLNDIQLALVAAEARLNFLLGSTGQSQNLDLMKRFLLWLAGVAGSHYQYQVDELTNLQARAMYLVNIVATNRDAGVPVPYLRYEAYKDIVGNVQDVLRTASDKLRDYQNQIRARKAEEREVDREKSLNENIIASGRLLQEYIGTQGSYQQSMENMFASVGKDKETELEMASKQADKLSASVTEQRTVVDKAITKYQDDVADWQTKQTIKAAIDIASNLFALGFTFAAPASSITALKDLGETVQKIQKAVKVFDAVIKTYRSINTLPKNPQYVVDALKDTGPSGLDMPSTLEWDEMKVKFDATLSSGPDIGAKTSLSAAFAILVLRGKALLQSQKTIQGIAADLSAARQRIQLQDDQKKRLDDLKTNLDAKPSELDTAKIDLVGLSGQHLFFQRQMLMILASTVVIQDRALQYEYLRPPTPVGSFTMPNLQLAIFNQSQSINKGLTAQPLPVEQTHPIIFEIHGVKPENITNNNRLTFDISVNKREFASFNYVRVQSVAVEIGGIISTKSGKYYTELVFEGSPFFDRGFDGEILTFQTTPRLFTGLHEVTSSSHDVSDKPLAVLKPEAFVLATGQDPFSGKISNITPFSTWRVSLPKSASNEDIKFDDYSRGVTVRLIFRIYAQLKEANVSSSELYRSSLHRLTRGDFVKPTVPVSKIKLEHDPLLASELVTKTDAPVLLSAMPPVLAPTASPPTRRVAINDVLNMMSGKSVCAGWDVVFSMTRKEVNDQLYRQYNDRLGNPKFMRETGNIVSEHKTSEGVTTRSKFYFVFNAPRLQFLLNNSNSAQIFLPIKSGHYEYSIFTRGSWKTHSKADVNETNKSYIQGDVLLGIFPGSVSSQHNISIKLNEGAFSAHRFGGDVPNPTLRSVLTDYFTSLKDGYEVYNFGTLDFKRISVLESLTPTDFKFNVCHTPSNRDLLQLFIATTGRLQSTTLLNLEEPIPSIYENSLIISSKIFFQNVLRTSLDNGGIGLAFELTEAANDGNKDKAWSLKANAGSVSAPYPETRVSQRQEVTRAVIVQFQGTTEIESYVKVDNNTAVVDLTGMKFVSGDTASRWDVKMIYDVRERAYDFKYGSRFNICGLVGCTGWSSIDYHDHSLNVNIQMSSNLPLSVSGTGQNQLVEIHAVTSKVNLTGNLEPPAGVCECNDRELQKTFLDNLKKAVPGKLVNIFNQPFKSVSLFALNNLLFPAKNFIDMQKGFVPGDMVVFGKFTKT